MAWFKREKQKIAPVEKKGVPDGLWVKCPTCSEFLYKPELDKSLSVCRHCSYHFRIDPKTYHDLLLDKGSSKEIFANIRSKDFLNFKAEKKYKDQLDTATKKTGQNDAINTYIGTINSKDVILGIMNFAFIGGSMGSVVGEKVSRMIDYAHENKLPMLLVCASGGARMQEGALSLMQLAKTSAKLAQFSDGGGLYIPILTDPTTGGVTASYGMLGDLILAEPGALIGFAGPRVIKQTIGQDLPEGFQRTEFLKEKGFVDHIVTREKMKSTLYKIISILHE